MGEKNIGKLLFKEYGISEWEDKCVLLSNEETIGILNALKNGEYNILVELVKLPYPKFACEYFKLFMGNLEKRKERIPDLDNYLIKETETPSTFGYKLYVLSNNAIKILVKYIKCPEKSINQILLGNGRVVNFRELMGYFNLPLESIYKAKFIEELNKNAIKRYNHIMSYIDAQEAERLGLTSFTFKRFDEYRGFALHEKLNALNPLIRHIVMENMGFNGRFVPIYEIADSLNISTHTVVSMLTDEFYLAFSRSAGEFKNYLRLIDKKYGDDERREYASKSPYKKISERIEATFLANYLKKEGEDNPTVPFTNIDYANYLNGEYYPQITKKGHK